MLTLKKILFLSILLSSINSFSQKREKIEYLSNFDLKTLHWGFYLGANVSDYKISYKEAPQQIGDATDNIITKVEPGFNIGLIGDIRLHNNINLRLEPGVFFTARTLTYNYIHEGDNHKANQREAASTFLYIPLLVQFSTNRYKNIRPYVTGGVAYGRNFTSNFNRNEDNANKVFRLQANNYFYEIGIGMDFYFFYFKFSPSIRGVFAINNELQRDFDDVNPNKYSKWTTPIDYLGTRGIFLRLSFQ